VELLAPHTLRTKVAANSGAMITKKAADPQV
jgi:hypothetical protein